MGDGLNPETRWIMNFARYKLWLLLGTFGGFLAVALGSFGAHGLEIHLPKSLAREASLSASERAEKQAHKLDIWETATRYCMYHSLALLAVGLLAARRCGLVVNLAGVAFTLGTLIFSGSLYGFVLTDLSPLAKTVPFGGGLFLIGWICLAIAVVKDSSAAPAAR
jgi:uncharacterized membrane protein YgdD (TMEM256/DUF423 family)